MRSRDTQIELIRRLPMQSHALSGESTWKLQNALKRALLVRFIQYFDEYMAYMQTYRRIDYMDHAFLQSLGMCAQEGLCLCKMLRLSRQQMEPVCIIRYFLKVLQL